MAPDYKKGNPPIGGTDFEVQLHALFALGGLLHFRNNNWELANEHEEAGKFDDLVFQTDEGDVLLQAKHKQKGKIVENQFLSIKPDNDDFSLAKYILSYKSIQCFNIKLLLLVTNTEISALTETPVNEYEIISKIFENCKIYRIPKSYVTILNKKILEYKNNLTDKQQLKNIEVEENDINNFIEKFVCVTIKDGNLDNVIRNRLDTLKNENVSPVASYNYVINQIKDWYKSKASKACFLNPQYMKSILYGEKNKSEIDNFLDESVLFAENYLFSNFNLITVDEPSDLKIKKIMQSIWIPYKRDGKLKENLYNDTLFLNGEYSIDVCKNMVECFSINKFKFLLVLCRGILKKEIKKMYQTVNNILSQSPEGKNKKVIFVCDNKYDFGAPNLKLIIDTISYKSFLPETQIKLFQKIVIFQGKSIMLKDLCCHNVDLITNCDEVTIAKLLAFRNYIISYNINKNELKSYYIERTLNTKHESFSEKNILSQCHEKVLVLFDQPGSGKSTLLIKLAKLWTHQYPNKWVISLDLGVTINYLRSNCSNSLLDVINLHVKPSDDFQTNLLCVLNKYILIDGLDEISSTDRALLLPFIKKVSLLSDVERIIVATRCYNFILDEINTIDNIAIVELRDFSKSEQINFLRKYFKHSMNINIQNADRFVQTLPEVLKHFLSIPLYLEITADVFADHFRHNKPLHNNVALISNTFELFNLFMLRKKQQFIQYKCSCENNSILDNILSDCFDRYLEELEPLAVRNNFQNGSILKALEVDTHKGYGTTVLHTGVLRQIDKDLGFTHKTFEEYFSARYLWRIMSQPNVCKELLSVIFLNVFMNLEKQNICHFIDCILETEDPNKSKDISQKLNDFIAQFTWNENANFLNLASQGSVNILKLLFDKGEHFSTFVNRRGNYNETALLLAAHHLPTIKYLVKNGADIYAKDSNGFSVLHYAVTKFSSFDNFKIQHNAISKSLLYRQMMSHMKSAQHNIYRYIELENHMKPIAREYQKSVILYRPADNFKEIIKYFVSCGLSLDKQTNLGITVLHYVAYCGLYDEFKYLHNLGASLYFKDIYGNNIMHYAVLGGSIEIVKYLNTLKVSLTTANIYGSTPIHFTPIGNSMDISNFFISQNVDINTEDKFGRTVLFYVNSVTSLELVKLFIKFKVDPTKRSTDSSYNILHMSAFTNAVDIVKYLTEEWPKLYSPDKMGQFPEHYAAEGDSENVLRYFKNVLDKQITETRDNNDCSILHLASVGDSIHTVRYLVTELAMDPTTPDRFKNTPLEYAAGNGAIKVLQFFQACKIKFKVFNDENATLLHYASKHDSVNVFKYLHNNCDLDINKVDSSGRHVIHYAAENDSLNILTYLLEVGISEIITDANGDTILHRSALGNAMTTTRYIFENFPKLYVPNNKKYFPVHHAVIGDSKDVVEYFIEKGVDLDILLNNNISLLHIAAGNSFKVFKFLIEKRKMDPTFVDKTNQCSVHYAAENDKVDVIKYLCRRDKSILERVDKVGGTAMHHAALGNALSTLEYLDECGVSIVDRDNNGLIPLHYACKNNAMDAIKYLLRNKVNINYCDYRKNTVLHWCAVGNATKAFRFFVKDCDFHKINELNRNEEQPIHTAIKYDSLDIVKFIFFIHNPDFQFLVDKERNSLLHFAVKYDSIRVIQYFVEELNMSKYTTNKHGKTPLDFVREYKSKKALNYFNLPVNQKTCTIS